MSIIAVLIGITFIYVFIRIVFILIHLRDEVELLSERLLELELDREEPVRFISSTRLTPSPMQVMK